MTTIMAQVSVQNYNIRNDSFRRFNAKTAYNSLKKYSGDNQKALESLENLRSEKTEVKEADVSNKGFNKLGAGQMKQVALPIGKTLEETIDLWREVRAEAISGPQPTTADFQLAATASSKIRQVEVELGLHQQTAVKIKTQTMDSEGQDILITKKRYEQAITSYSFHVQMQKNGFKHDLPSIQKIA